MVSRNKFLLKGLRMNRWDELRNKCPMLYKDKIVFQCGAGWYDIIQRLSVQIENLLTKYSKVIAFPETDEAFDMEIFAIQIKEKYGTLRFYMSCETDEITNLIKETEALSKETCETCGAKAKLRKHAFMEVKCDECFKDNK